MYKGMHANRGFFLRRWYGDDVQERDQRIVEGNNTKEEGNIREGNGVTLEHFLEKFIILKQVAQTVLVQISLALLLSNEFVSRIYIYIYIRQIPFPEECMQTS